MTGNVDRVEVITSVQRRVTSVMDGRPPSSKGFCNVACRSLAVMYPASDTVR